MCPVEEEKKDESDCRLARAAGAKVREYKRFMTSFSIPSKALESSLGEAEAHGS